MTQIEKVDRNLKVAYIVHRFPSLTETFIMREIYWIRQEEVEVNIFSLLPPKHAQVHAQAQELLAITHYAPFFSWQVIKAQLHFLRRSPRRYWHALVTTIWQTYREPKMLLLMLALFPKSVYFARQIEELGIQHVHAHFVWLEGLAAGITKELLDCTFSITPHAFDLFRRDPINVCREIKNTSQIITISNYNRAYIADLCPRIDRCDIEIVRCGLETDWLHPPSKTTQRQPIQLLSIGRPIEKKGHEYLIEACALLAKRGVDFKCNIVVGKKARAAILQSMIDDYGLQRQVALLDERAQDGILELYHNSNIFILACVIAQDGDRDGIPVVLMEAMACALPVVTTSISGIPDLVQDGKTGLLVKERDAVSLADALEKLIADESLRRQLGEQGRLKILQEFQIQPNVAKLAAIFRHVSKQRRDVSILLMNRREQGGTYAG